MPVILANKVERQSFNQDDFHQTSIETVDIDGGTETVIFQGRSSDPNMVSASLRACWTIKRTEIREIEGCPTVVNVMWAMENAQLKTDCHFHQASSYDYGYLI